MQDPRNKVASIYRGCEDKPLHANEIIEDESYRMYFTACQTDLCNGGSGKAANGGAGSAPLGDKSTIYAPGIGNNGAASATFSVVLVASLLFLNLV